MPMNYKLSFDEWLQLVFDHPVTVPHWYWDQWDKEFGTEKQLQYATMLFMKSADLLIGTFSPEQIDQGMGMLISGPTRFSIANTIWLRALPQKIREDCIASMVPLFRELFAVVPVEFSCFMWWDELRGWDHEDVDPQTKEIVLQALMAILEIPSRDCQLSALHGLNHLWHPKREQIIREFLAQNPNVDEFTKEFAGSAIEGKMM
jgi:hypothetical protein